MAPWMNREPAPPARIRIVGRALNGAIARAPWLWPLLRSPMRRYFDDLGRRLGRSGPRPGSVEHLTAARRGGSTTSTPGPERILDLGTGTGEVALFLAREYPTASIRGVDVSEEMIREAKAKVGLDPEGRIAFKVADAAALPYDDASFDLVTQVNVPPFFTEIARVLRPGGHVAIAASLGERDAVLHAGAGARARPAQARDRAARDRLGGRRDLRRRPQARGLRRDAPAPPTC